MVLVLLLILLMEYTTRVSMHQARFYQRIAVAIPVILAGLARASGTPWAATTAAGIYSLFLLGCLWILPLFPAEPKLGPVYHPVTHFVPPEFPLLLIAPALALDLLWRRTQAWNKWLLAAISGALFVGVFATLQWFFAEFLMSPGARNWVFGAHYYGYYAHPNSYLVRNVFLPTEAHFWRGMALAVVFSILSTRLGLGWGDWMRTIRR